MLLTPWSPHLNLLGHPRLQRPAYEDPVDTGALPRFIEIPTAPTTRNPKSETFVTTSGDGRAASAPGGDSQRNLSKLPHPLVQPQTHQCKFLFHRYRNLHVRCSHPAEREDSIQQRQRPAEVYTVLTIAGAYNGNEIATLMDDQKALHTAKVNELLNMDKFGVVEVVDRPQSQQVFSTRWVSKHRDWMDHAKVRLVARGFVQTVQFRFRFLCRNAKAHDFAQTSHDNCTSRKSSCFRRLSQCISSITDAK